MFPHHSFKVNILFLLLLICSSVFSHPIENRSTYPFDASISVSGQSVYLSDYSDEFDTPVRLSLRCNDPSIGSIQVKLVVGIRSGAFSCQSHSYAVTAPITMGFGDSYTLSSAEVASYYKLQNLQYTGLVSGRIPEGVAEFTVQVQEYHSGAKLSNTAFTVRSLKLLSPPRLQSPTNGREVSFIQSSNLLFTWSGGGSTLPMQTIGYEFILKEIADTLAAPETAFNYSPVVYTEHTHLSSLIYSVDKPTLQEGKTYGWCVRAYVDKAGAAQSATSYFTNAGYSEIFTFTVKDTEQQTTAPVTATAKPTEEDNPNCGVAPTIDLSNTTPIETLQVGDTIMAGDFPIVLLEVSGMGGRFSGKGSVEIPYISHALRFAVEFENITVNTDKRLIDGKITGVRNQSLDNIANLDAIDYGATRPQEKAVVSADISLGVALPNAPPPTLQYNPSSGLLTFYDATGSVIAETTLNNPQGAKVFPITVKDEQGNLYQVNETLNSDSTTVHTLTPLGKQEGELPYKSFNPDAIDAYAAVVEFSPVGSAYSFDTYQDYYKDIALIYKQNTLEATLRYPYLGNDYYTPWQFVPLGKQVTLSAKIKINDKKAGIDPSKVIFRTDEGLVIASEYNEKDKSYRLTVPSASAEGYYFLHALYKVGDGNYLHLGQVGIDTHRPIRARVVLVDMGGVYQQEQLAQSLNTITQAVGLTWQVDRINGFEVSKELTEQLFDKDSHELFSYNDVQKALNIALKSHLADKFDASASYVFMFDKSPIKGDRDIIGFMPRGGQYGYLHCNKLSGEELATILAHELMHGQFLLRHTIDDKYKAGLKAGINPQNLMDYKGGTHIAKWQWDQIYDPAITTSLIKYDEEGEFWLTVLKMGAKAAVNVFVQMSMIYLTNDNVDTFWQAWHYVDYVEVALNAVIPSSSMMKKYFKNIKNPDQLEALFEIAGNLYLCVKDKQINSIKDFNECGTQAIFDYLLGMVAEVSIDKAVQKVRKFIPNFSYKKSHIGEQQHANAPPAKVGKLSQRLANHPKLNKKLTELGELKDKFVEDFDNITDDQIAIFEQNPNLVDSWKRFAQCKAPDDLRKNIGAIKTHATDITTKKRPDPSTYLPKEYIEAHMKKFEKGAAMVKPSKNLVGRPEIGHKNSFCSDVESVETVMRESKNYKDEIEQIRYIEKKLGFEAGYLGDNPKEIYLIYLKPDQIKNPRFPSGNEGGANEFWIPGGYTASEDAIGVPEIIIDCSELSTNLFNKKYNNKISIDLFE